MTRCMGCMKEYGEGVDICPHCGYARGTAAREAYHLAPESILAGKYIVGRVLGFGGFGVTYIGYDAQLDRVVAIKEFLPTAFATRMPGGTAVTVYEGGATSQFGFGLERFVQEAQRLAQFNGIPGITDIYDTFVGNNTAYIVMQYLQGSDVKQALQTGGPMPYEKARDIVLRICDTLAPVHVKGIIHRDISPDNIFLTDDGEVKLLDFGAARYESSVNSKSLSVILKSGYAPEEQYRSRGDQGPWTDVYALAATFYKMLTGITPPDSMERAVKDEIREPSKLGADIPQSAENALMNALNIRKADRTQSVKEFKDALQADGVERVKVKARRAQTGKVPLPAIVALGIAGVLIVVFIALNATGTVNIVGGTGVPDNFGAAADGQLTVPDLTGKTEEEAKQALEELGLVPEKGTVLISAAAQGTVAGQEPLAGRYASAGDTVIYNISAGLLEDAIEAGYVPNPVGMSAAQCAGFSGNLGQYGVESTYADFVYEYSDSVPAGTVTRFTRNSDGYRITYFISAGPNDGPSPFGQARAPLMYIDHDLNFKVAAASAFVPEEDAQSPYDSSNFHYEVSKDGIEWQDFFITSLNRYYYEPDTLVSPLVPSARSQATSDLRENFETLAGETWQVRMVHIGNPSGDTEPNEELGIYPLNQTLRLQVEGEAVRVDSMEMVPWEDLDALVESRQLEDYTLEEWGWMRENEPLNVWRIKGNFQTQVQYGVDSWRQYGRYSYCSKSGELLVAMYDDEMNADGSPVALTVYAPLQYDITEDGSSVTVTMPPPCYYAKKS